MATKLEELLEELERLRKWDILEGDGDMDFDIIKRPAGEFIKSGEILQLIAKYTETTSTYKPGDKVLITKSCLKTFNGTEGYLIKLLTSKEKLWKIKHSLGICYFSEEKFEPIY